jgi:hypothetical protein
MGVLIPGADLVWPLKLFFYILPMKYGLRSMVYTEFIDSTYKDCHPSDLICFGTDGDQVLKTLSSVYTVFEDKSTMGVDIGCLLAISAVLKAFYIAQVIVKSRRVSTIEEPASQLSTAL